MSCCIILAAPLPSPSHGHAAPPIPQHFFAHLAELVAPKFISCLLMKRQEGGELLWGVIVEMETYFQDDPACHGYCRRSPSNETLFGELGQKQQQAQCAICHRPIPFLSP